MSTTRIETCVDRLTMLDPPVDLAVGEGNAGTSGRLRAVAFLNVGDRYRPQPGFASGKFNCELPTHDWLHDRSGALRQRAGSFPMRAQDPGRRTRRQARIPSTCSTGRTASEEPRRCITLPTQ